MTKPVDFSNLPKKQNQFLETWKVFSQNKASVVGLIVAVILLVTAFSAELIMPFEYAIRQDIPNRLQPPGGDFLLGTDNMGRDYAARMLHGARVSLTMGFLPTLVSLFVAMILGGTAALYGKWVDDIIMRICDVFACIPGVLLALTFVAALGPGLFNMLVAITIASIPSRTRFVRSVVLNIVELDYIEAGRACGTSDFRIITKHVLPNAMGPLILNAVAGIAGMIMLGAGLSFLGMGIEPPYPEWGVMLAENQRFLRTHPFLMLVPGFAILISVLCFNLVGDGLRDALDPRLRR